MDDPRKDEDWKIQKRKGFLKDRECKAEQVKLSKTAKRNSKESIFNKEDKLKPRRTVDNPEENTFDFLDDITSRVTPVVPMPGTSKGPSAPNLDTSRIMNWARLFESSQMDTNEERQEQPRPVLHQAELNQQAKVPAKVPEMEKSKSPPGKTRNQDGRLELTTISNEGSMRQEIEIELLSCEDEKFTGSLTMQEAKHGIFRDCLGFKDFKNFDGVRFAFKGIRIVAFKLKEAINVDDLIELQHFDYKRKIKKNNSLQDQIIRCKIKGLRSEATKMYLERKAKENLVHEDGSTLVKITGCEYKVTEERLTEVLAHWGVMGSKIMEEVFHDPHDKEGSNRTGIYTVKMNLHQKIPEWLPLDGLRVKIQHKGIQKLCNTCYGNHLRKDCTEEKKSWADYILQFRSENPEIPDNFYGKWIEIVRDESIKRPTEKDFCLPTTSEECDQIYAIFQSCGIDETTGMKMLKERKERFDSALKEYNSKQNNAH